MFADQIEWMHTRLSSREHVALSVHTHNDRGTGVAAAELAHVGGRAACRRLSLRQRRAFGQRRPRHAGAQLLLAGHPPGAGFLRHQLGRRARWKRPRGCPFIRATLTSATSCSRRSPARTRMPSRRAWPLQKPDALWEVPYLPIDPADLGRTYDSVIRINSQSGKGGIAYLLERDYGVVMPRRMQVEFSALVQGEADSSATEMTSQQLWSLFERTYLASHESTSSITRTSCSRRATSRASSSRSRCSASAANCAAWGHGPIAATVNALALPMRIDNYEERALRAWRGCFRSSHRRSRSRWNAGQSLRRRPARQHRHGVGACRPQCRAAARVRCGGRGLRGGGALAGLMRANGASIRAGQSSPFRIEKGERR